MICFKTSSNRDYSPAVDVSQVALPAPFATDNQDGICIGTADNFYNSIWTVFEGFESKMATAIAHQDY